MIYYYLCSTLNFILRNQKHKREHKIQSILYKYLSIIKVLTLKFNIFLPFLTQKCYKLYRTTSNNYECLKITDRIRHM